MRDVPRKLLALATLAAVLAVPVARTLVHADERSRGEHVESSHDPDRCRVAHHHVACVQLFASAAAASRPSPAPAPGAVGFAPPGLAAGRSASEPIRGDARPRAPPSLLV